MAFSPNEPDVGVGEAIVQVAEDAKAYVTAQVDVAKAVATVRLRAAKLGIALGVAAVFLLGSAITALLVGLILSLATVTGPLLATGIVVVAVLAVAGILGKLAATRIGRAFGGDA